MSRDGAELRNPAPLIQNASRGGTLPPRKAGCLTPLHLLKTRSAA